MHTYIYDSFVSEKKYTSAVNELETNLTDFGVGGRICRLTKLRNLNDIVKQELRRNPKTLVVVGNDAIIHQVISLLSDFNVPLGIVPLGPEKDNQIASGLGISLENAAQILSARRIIKLDLGIINHAKFLYNASFFAKNVKIDIDQNYSLRIASAEVQIVNFVSKTGDFLGKNPSPEDGLLNLVINKKISGFFKKQASQTMISFRKIKIDGSYNSVLLDGFTRIKSLEKVDILPQAIEIVVGKDRSF